MAELDCLLSLATAAREHNYVRPELTTDTVLDIQGGVWDLASSRGVCVSYCTVPVPVESVCKPCMQGCCFAILQLSPFVNGALHPAWQRMGVSAHAWGG